MTDTALVTGGFGLVGTETVNRLAAAGRRVVVADLDTPANRKKARALPAGVTARWADLTDADAVGRLVSEVSPSVIVHLAAVIPPPLYKNPGLARKVNVECHRRRWCAPQRHNRIRRASSRPRATPSTARVIPTG